MTALVTADLHFTAKVRDQYRFKTMDTIAGLIEKHNADMLIINGDLTEEKDFHSATLVNDVVEVISCFADLCDVIINRGNHDYTDVDWPFFYFLRRIKNVGWINKVEVLGGWLFLPHTRDYKTDWKDIDLSGIDLVFAHNTFEGTISEHGKKLSGIPTDIFEETKVISGDVHTPQTIGPVTYVGAPYTVDFGDAYQPRVLLLDKSGMRSIPVPGPQKRLLELSKGYERNFVKPGWSNNDILKIRYKLAPDEKDDWFAIRDHLREEFSDYNVHIVQPVKASKDKSVIIKRPESKSDERLVEEYGKKVKASKEVLKIGLELTKEA